LAVSIGRLVAEKFSLLKELGHGGMGTVWVAEHRMLRSKVAIKLIDPRYIDSTATLRRFAREARAAAALRSPHVVQIFDFGVDRGAPYIVMELLEGRSLAAHIARRRRLSAADTLSVMHQLGKAMSRAHEAGIVHRDLKPDNIFLVDDDDCFIVKVLDFGIAKALHGGESGPPGFRTETGAFVGTPHYASPEQAQGRQVDARSDLWAMAIVAFECLTGKPPFRSQSVPEIIAKVCHDPMVVPSEVAEVPPGFDSWFQRATQRDPDQRFQTAGELVSTLRDLLERAIRDGALPDVTPEDALGARDSLLPTGPLETYPSQRGQERRGEARHASSIPAGIDGGRDIYHVALIQNISPRGALLSTRLRCEVGRDLTLNIHANSSEIGQSVLARVVRVTRWSPERGAFWRYDVAVQFRAPLPEGLLDALLEQVSAWAADEEGGLLE
jgi:serine/threonine protein kinase